MTSSAVIAQGELVYSEEYDSDRKVLKLKLVSGISRTPMRRVCKELQKLKYHVDIDLHVRVFTARGLVPQAIDSFRTTLCALMRDQLLRRRQPTGRSRSKQQRVVANGYINTPKRNRQRHQLLAA